MRLNNLLACLFLGIGVVGGAVVYRGRPTSRVIVHLQEPGVDLIINGKTIHHAARTETLDLAPGPCELSVLRGKRQLYHERFFLEDDDEREVAAWWF